ncbi:hypothetical protein [Nannocystis pusilla]|uniref:hypothetical protein n=1 Tax=Nannocystis pusilla TaxID=889268 RepID=UPI003B813025
MITLTSLAALTLSSALTVAPREPVYDDAAAVPVPQPQTRRVALIVGANDGGPGRVKLRYAGSDAKALSRVLADVGGIDRRDAFVLLDPNPTQLLDGFRWAQDRVAKARAAGERVQFLFIIRGTPTIAGSTSARRRSTTPSCAASSTRSTPRSASACSTRARRARSCGSRAGRCGRRCRPATPTSRATPS